MESVQQDWHHCSTFKLTIIQSILQTPWHTKVIVNNKHISGSAGHLWPSFYQSSSHFCAPDMHMDGKETSRNVVPVFVPKTQHSHTLRRDLLPVQGKYLHPIKSAYQSRLSPLLQLPLHSPPPLSRLHPSLVFVIVSLAVSHHR